MEITEQWSIREMEVSGRWKHRDDGDIKGNGGIRGWSIQQSVGGIGGDGGNSAMEPTLMSVQTWLCSQAVPGLPVP